MIKILYIVEPMLGIGPNIDANLIAKQVARKFSDKIDIKIILEKDDFSKEKSSSVSWEHLSPWRQDYVANKLRDLEGNELSEEIKQKRVEFLIEVCDLYKPDVLLLHNYMSGSRWDSIIDFEILPLIEFAKNKNSDIKVYSYMIGMPDGFENITDEGGKFFLESVKKNTDKVFLRSDSLPLFLETCPLATRLPGHFVPVGYSADEDTPQKITNSDEKYIIISAGGGDIALNLFKKSIQACSLLTKDLELGNVKWKIFLGPMQEKNELILQEYLKIVDCVDRVELIVKADEKIFLSYLMYNCLVSVSQCGQRTFTNLEVTGANSILVPRESDGKEFEQLYRAVYMEKIGRAKLIREKNLFPEVLNLNIKEIFKNKPTKIGLQMSGPENLLRSIIDEFKK